MVTELKKLKKSENELLGRILDLRNTDFTLCYIILFLVMTTQEMKPICKQDTAPMLFSLLKHQKMTFQHTSTVLKRQKENVSEGRNKLAFPSTSYSVVT